MPPAPEKGWIFDIQDLAVTDGPEVRTVIFFKGCPLACRWCANPEGQLLREEIMHLRSLCTGCLTCQTVCPAGAVERAEDRRPRFRREACGSCAEKPCVLRCPARALKRVGRAWGVEELYKRLRQNALFYRNSGGGITLSGGEPLSQAPFVGALLRRCAASGISVGLETCGHFEWDAVEPLWDDLDFCFFDVKCLDDATHRRLTGQSNGLILDNLARLAQRFPHRITVSVPVIGGVNDHETFFEELAQRCLHLGISHMRLLPYHSLGRSKYDALGRTYPMGDDGDLPPDGAEPFAALVRRQGLACRVD